jgi:hypothetical protein
MLCALTQRKLKPGAWEDFRDAFVPGEDRPAPEGWTRFYAIRNANDENEVITFGFFDGTLDELRASQGELEYDELRASTEQYVESVGVDDIFEVIDERAMN